MIITYDGENREFSRDWTALCEKRGTALSASEWLYSGTGELTDAALSGNRAVVKLAAECDGLLQNKVTLANGEVHIDRWHITVNG